MFFHTSQSNFLFALKTSLLFFFCLIQYAYRVYYMCFEFCNHQTTHIVVKVFCANPVIVHLSQITVVFHIEAFGQHIVAHNTKRRISY